MKEPWTEGTKPWWEKGYCETLYLDYEQVVSRVPCEVVAIIATATTGTGEFWLYNGPNTRSPLVLPVAVSAAFSWVFAPAEPMKFDRGLFVHFHDHIASVVVMWRPLPAGWRP